MAFKVVNDSVITDLKQGLLENLSIDSTLVLERDPTSGNIVLRNVELDSATVDISGYTTDDIAEGSSNLYYTNLRVDSRIALQVGANLDLSSKTTDDLTEGSNLYYTDARAQAVSINSLSEDLNPTLSANLNVNNYAITNLPGPIDPADAANKAYVDSVVSAGTGSLTTDAIAEGSTNLYFTDARAQAALSGNLAAVSFAIDQAEADANAYTDTAINNLIDGATSTLDTLNELAAAIGDDPNFITTINNSIVTAETSANSYTDAREVVITTAYESYADQAEAAAVATASADATAKANAAQTAAESYTDSREIAITASYQAYADIAESDAITSATTYTDTQIAQLGNTYYTETESDNLFVNVSGDTMTGALVLSGAPVNPNDAATKSYVDSVVSTGTGSLTTDDIPEASNLYYTDTRAQAAITGGTGVTVTNGVVSVGQDVATTSDVEFHDVIIAGDLTVQGTTTTINAQELAIQDNLIYLNEGSTVTNPDLGWSGNYNDGTYRHAGMFRDATDGRFKAFEGYTLEPGQTIDTSHASFSLADIQASTFIGNLTGNVTGNVTGTVSSIANHSTTDLSEGSNLYYTDARVDARIPTTVSSFTNDSGYITNISGFTTTDLAEGTNKYYTDERVDDRVSTLVQAGQNISVTYNDALNTLTISAATQNGGGYDLSNNTTDDVAEGATNLYFTAARTQTIIDANTAGFLTAETDTLQDVTTRGATTTDRIITGGIRSDGYSLFNAVSDSHLPFTVVDIHNAQGARFIMTGDMTIQANDVIIGQSGGSTPYGFTIDPSAHTITANGNAATNGGGTLSFLDSKIRYSNDAHEFVGGEVRVRDGNLNMADLYFSGNRIINLGDPTDAQDAATKAYVDSSIPTVPTNVSAFVNDAGYLTSETDSQTLSFSSPNLTISNGNTVDLSALNTDTTYSQATNTTLGLVKIGYAENGKNYPVELSNGQMFVNVPWTDTDTNTTYTAGTGLNLTGTVFSVDSTIAPKTYVDTAIANLVDTAPATLDTLNELAAALGDDPNFATTVTNSIATKQDAATALTTTTVFGGDVSGTYDNIVIANNSHDHTGLLKRADIASGADLNTYTTDGYYHQNSNANAAAGTNYPTALAGMLTVQADGSMVYQKYQSYNGTGTYQRTYYNGTWYAWETIWDSTNDGAGSGLDADLLDGKHASDFLLVGGKAADAELLDGIDSTSFLRSDASDTFTTLTGAEFTLTGTSYWQVSGSDSARQRADARDDATNFSRLHWYGMSDTGATSNFRHAWYDGAAYINVTAESGAVTFGGAIIATGDVTAYSDERLKDNIANINNAMDKVDQLRGVTFTHKDTGTESTGLIAQDVQKVLPEAITEDNDGYLGVKYGNMTGLLVEAMKELKDRIEALEEENKELKAKLNS